MTQDQNTYEEYSYPVEKMYPKRILANSHKSIVVALSSDTVGKMYHNNSLDQLIYEDKLMKYANEVNDLVVKSKGVVQDIFGNYMLTMERIYPMEPRAFDSITIENFMVEAEEKLRDLHVNGFAYRDLFKTRIVEADGYPRYANFLLTTSGIRLIDTEMSKLYTDMSPADFWSDTRLDIHQLYDLRSKLLFSFRPNHRTSTNTIIHGSARIS